MTWKTSASPRRTTGPRRHRPRSAVPTPGMPRPADLPRRPAASVMRACRPSAPGSARHAHARPVLRSPRHVRAERTDGGGHLDGGGVDAVDRWSGGGLAGFSRVRSRTWATQKSSSTSLYRARRGAGTVTRRCTTVQSPVCAIDGDGHFLKETKTLHELELSSPPGGAGRRRTRAMRCSAEPGQEETWMLRKALPCRHGARR